MKRICLIALLWLCCIHITGCSQIPAEEKSSKEMTFSQEEIPEYSGKPYVILNQNIPEFKESDKTENSFENYSEQDELGRCGVAFANLSKELMPVEKRADISRVRPSGWQSVRYRCVEGRYLYNRCHLIGYQLAGENANEKNLITGTRYMNVEGMLPFENEVADYIEATGNHVLYRVTPVFKGKNLVAHGVILEAWSVEDEGEGICFHVYVYNVQPGIVIDYKTGESWLAEDTSSAEDKENTSPKGKENKKSEKKAGKESEKTAYIINANTGKFHLPSCGSVDQMSEANKRSSNASKEELKKNGYFPCRRCIK